MVLKISERSKDIAQSEIRNMSIECDKVNGINLSQGICDLETPECVKEEAKKAISEGVNHYTRYDGLPELREAVADKLRRENNIQLNSENEIVISGGATGAFYCACLALLNPGDETIVFEPYYGYHINTLLAAGAIPLCARLNQPNWTFNAESLERKVTKKTRAIVINTPANPSGKIFSESEIEQLADFAVKHDLFVFTDEIYEYFTYDGRKHISPGSLRQIGNRTITISGYSKTFSTTGWRIGYAACDERWAKMIGYVNDLVYVCAPAPLQIGIAGGVKNLNKEFYQRLAREYQKKRDKLCRALEEGGLTPNVPQGAYYVLANIGRIPGNTSKEKAMRLLQKTGIACVPGSAFYHDKDRSEGKNLARFCFAKKDEELDEACERLKKL